MKNLLLNYIKSFRRYQHIKSIKELDKNDIKIWTNEFEKELKKYGEKELKRQINNATNYNN